MKKTNIMAMCLSVILLAASGCTAEQPSTPATSTPEAPAPTEPVSVVSVPPVADAHDSGDENSSNEEGKTMAMLLYQGHASLRLTTAEGKVIYVDPYAGEGYDLPADLILVTHQHGDHNRLNLIGSKNPGCEVITEKEALKDGKQQTFDLGYVKVEAVEAGNKNHNPAQCVGYILTLSDGIQIYVSGDTSKTVQMETFAERNLDYTFLCCDGVYNMDIAEASECAALIGARHSIPYHMAPGELFSRERAEQFEAKGRLIVTDGEEIALVGE